MVRTSVTHSAIASCATFLFLPHSDVICDLLLNRRTANGIYLLNAHILEKMVGVEKKHGHLKLPRFMKHSYKDCLLFDAHDAKYF